MIPSTGRTLTPAAKHNLVMSEGRYKSQVGESMQLSIYTAMTMFPISNGIDFMKSRPKPKIWA